MRVLAINQFYAPDVSAGSQLLTELAEGLVRRGDEVGVVAGRGSYLGGGLLPARQIIHGVEVNRAWVTSFGKRLLVGRLSDYLSFYVTSIFGAVRQTRPDVILAVTTPPMIGAAAAIVARMRGVPLVTWVQDVYPEVAIAFDVMREGSAVSRGFSALQKLTHHESARIVAISDGMAARLVAQGALLDRIRVIPNWADGELIRPRAGLENDFRRSNELTDKFVVMYSGNLGVAHDFDTLIRAARILEDTHDNVVFTFVGDGNRRKETEELARGARNVRFLPYQPREVLGQSLSAADAHLISLRPGLEGLVVPSKVHGAMACGRPILYIGPRDCDVGRLVRENDIGWSGVSGDAEGLAAAIRLLVDDPARVTAQGARARQLFEAEYDRERALTRWSALLEEATSGVVSR